MNPSEGVGRHHKEVLCNQPEMDGKVSKRVNSEPGSVELRQTRLEQVAIPVAGEHMKIYYSRDLVWPGKSQ